MPDMEGRNLASNLRGIGVEQNNVPEWKQHTLPARETMVFDAETRLLNDPRQRERELFAKVPFIQWGT